MTRIWWAQIKAVVRIELRKTFFARRGLWIYFLALLPVLLFMGYSVANTIQAKRTASIARRSEKPLTAQDLQAVKTGMTKEEVFALLGKPPIIFRWDDRRDRGQEKAVPTTHEEYHYSDGQNDLYVSLVDGRVEGIHIEDGYNLGRDSIMFAGVFQFFFLRLAVFFGCLGIFMNLFRGEILDRSLHFYFLAPIRREVLMVGKFLAGLLATCVIFVTSELSAKHRLRVAPVSRQFAIFTSTTITGWSTPPYISGSPCSPASDTAHSSSSRECSSKIRFCRQ